MSALGKSSCMQPQMRPAESSGALHSIGSALLGQEPKMPSSDEGDTEGESDASPAHAKGINYRAYF